MITAGEDLGNLTTVCVVDYIHQGRHLILSNPVIAASGGYLRLGRLVDGEIQYSDGRDGPHQPFGEFYTDNSPEAKIFKNGVVFVDHWDEYTEVGNPWVDEDKMYFEARKGHVQAPIGWEIWSMSMTTLERVFVTNGANPCVYDGRLYFSTWNTEREEFDFSVTTI